MGTPTFQFRQFTIVHDRCAMKVGTDGVLVGAWSELPAIGNVLDVGTGSGLITLMVAQRGASLQVLGIDIDKDAVSQARENVLASPFSERIEIHLQSLQDLALSTRRFDAIVCNPPFFEEQLLPPDTSRSIARHVHTLSFEELISGAAHLLLSNGTFSVILPTTAFPAFRQLCFVHGLNLKRYQFVQGTATKESKRVLATFVLGESEVTEEPTLILNEGTQRTKDYLALTQDFYLR